MKPPLDGVCGPYTRGVHNCKPFPPRRYGLAGPRAVSAGRSARALSWPRVDPQTIAEAISRALAEDLGAGDVTTSVTVPEQARARARITQKAPGVVSGLELAERTFWTLD